MLWTENVTRQDPMASLLKAIDRSALASEFRKEKGKATYEVYLQKMGETVTKDSPRDKGASDTRTGRAASTAPV